ncbi:MAG TPA: metal ABC transporter permease, partial [Actinomycetota bacterium]|nr:metal ABC transporter permease [Actinomycetota bacterium]
MAGGAALTPWPFDRQYMQLALVAGLVVGASAPLIGAFLVQKRLSLMGDGIGHLAFAGVAGGLALNVAPVWVALGVAVVGAVAVERLRARGRASGDLALALFFYSGIAAGVVLTGLAGSLNANIFSYLFGSILTVQTSDVWIVVALGGTILATLALTGRALFAVVVDEEAARVAGIPVDVLNTILAVLTAVVIVAAMRVVGILLVAALMVLPVGASQQLTGSFRRTVLAAVGIGLGSVVVGLMAARVWGLAAGGTVVLVAAGAFAVT